MARGYQVLLQTCARYVAIAQGDTNYEIALTWIELNWNDPLRVAGGVRIIQETWNPAFYQGDMFDLKELAKALSDVQDSLNKLRLRDVKTFSSHDEEATWQLWNRLYEALGPRKRWKRPYVATAKTLHMLAPRFFVPFDTTIAEICGCYKGQPTGFVRFQSLMAEFARHALDTYVTEHGGDHPSAMIEICNSLYTRYTGSKCIKSLAKILDEYNWVTREDEEGVAPK